MVYMYMVSSKVYSEPGFYCQLQHHTLLSFAIAVPRWTIKIKHKMSKWKTTKRRKSVFVVVIRKLWNKHSCCVLVGPRCWSCWWIYFFLSVPILFRSFWLLLERNRIEHTASSPASLALFKYPISTWAKGGWGKEVDVRQKKINKKCKWIKKVYAFL